MRSMSARGYQYLTHTSAKCCTPIVDEVLYAATSHLYEYTFSLNPDMVSASIRRGATIVKSPAMDEYRLYIKPREGQVTLPQP